MLYGLLCKRSTLTRLWSLSGFRAACVLVDTWRIRTPFPSYETRNPIVPLCLSPQHSCEHILRPSGLTFGLRHLELFCLTRDPPPHPAPSPTLTLYGKGSWGVSVNGTWLKKFIYVYINMLPSSAREFASSVPGPPRSGLNLLWLLL